MTDTAATPSGDDALETELRRVAAAADPVPGTWRTVAQRSFVWTAIDAAPARLAYDSRVARTGRAAGAPPAGAAPREVRWSAPGRTVEVELDVGADELRAVGRVIPATSAEVTAVWPEGRRRVQADDDGTFRVEDLPRRPLCFVVVGGEQAVKTGWVVA